MQHCVTCFECLIILSHWMRTWDHNALVQIWMREFSPQRGVTKTEKGICARGPSPNLEEGICLCPCKWQCDGYGEGHLCLTRSRKAYMHAVGQQSDNSLSHLQPSHLLLSVDTGRQDESLLPARSSPLPVPLAITANQHAPILPCQRSTLRHLSLPSRCSATDCRHAAGIQVRVRPRAPARAPSVFLGLGKAQGSHPSPLGRPGLVSESIDGHYAKRAQLHPIVSQLCWYLSK